MHFIASFLNECFLWSSLEVYLGFWSVIKAHWGRRRCIERFLPLNLFGGSCTSLCKRKNINLKASFSLYREIHSPLEEGLATNKLPKRWKQKKLSVSMVNGITNLWIILSWLMSFLCYFEVFHVNGWIVLTRLGMSHQRYWKYS